MVNIFENNEDHQPNDANPNHYNIEDNAQPLRRASNVQILSNNYSQLKHSAFVYQRGCCQVNFMPLNTEKLIRSPQCSLLLHTVLHGLIEIPLTRSHNLQTVEKCDRKGNCHSDPSAGTLEAALCPGELFLYPLVNNETGGAELDFR